MFMCARVYDAALCDDTIRKCGSWPLDWLAIPDLQPSPNITIAE